MRHRFGRETVTPRRECGPIHSTREPPGGNRYSRSGNSPIILRSGKPLQSMRHLDGAYCLEPCLCFPFHSLLPVPLTYYLLWPKVSGPTSFLLVVVISLSLEFFSASRSRFPNSRQSRSALERRDSRGESSLVSTTVRASQVGSRPTQNGEAPKLVCALKSSERRRPEGITPLNAEPARSAVFR